MTEIVYSGDEIAYEIDGNYKPSIQSSADWLRHIRSTYNTDPVLWVLVCHARAWGTLPTVWALRD